MSQYPLHLYSTLPTISAPFSILGSSAILYIISRSKDKLSTTLNRLLVGLCVADLIFSFPFLFSKAIIKFEDRTRTDADGVIESYKYPGTTNWTACETQGFLISFGAGLSILYNIYLCIYYVCVIKLNYSVTKIKKKVEPFLHATPYMFLIISMIVTVATKSINPERGYCYISEYRPKDCESGDCYRGSFVWVLRIFTIVNMIVAFVAITGMMTVIYLQVSRQERRMRNAGYRSTNAARAAGNESNMIAGRQSQAQANNASSGLLRQNVTNSRKVLNQGLAYAGAFLATWFFFIYFAITKLAGGDPKAVETLDLLSSFFNPLQGFFNFLVFIYPRVTRQLRGNHDMNVQQALWAAIRCTPIPPRNNRNRGGDNAAAQGTGTERRGNGAVGGTRNISGLRGTGGAGNGAAAATTRNISGLRGTGGRGNVAVGGSRNISGLKETGGAGNGAVAGTRTFANKKSVCFGNSVIDDKDQQRRQKISDSESLARVSQNTASTISFHSSIDKVQQEEKTEIEGAVTNNVVDEEVGMIEGIESASMEGEEVEGNGDGKEDEETGLLRGEDRIGEEMSKRCSSNATTRCSIQCK